MPHEITEPKPFKFGREGDSISGLLIDIETINIGLTKTPTPRYLFEDETGELHYVVSTVDLRKKIRSLHIGKKLSIKWEATRQLPNASHPLRIFRVMEL